MKSFCFVTAIFLFVSTLAQTSTDITRKALLQQKERDSEALRKDSTKTYALSDQKIEPLIKPAFLTGPGSLHIIPSINMLATKTCADSGSGSAFSLNVFVSATADTAYLKDKSNYFIPQASNVGFGFHYVQNFKNIRVDAAGNPTSQISTNFRGYYLNKKIPLIDSADGDLKEINTIGLFHVTAGLEYTHKNVFSLFTDLNVISTVSGRESYSQYFNTNDDATVFFDFGIKTDFYLEKNSTDQHIMLSLNFLLINESMKKLYRTSDYLIPTVGISYFKLLGD